LPGSDPAWVDRGYSRKGVIMKKEHLFAMLQVLFIASLIILPACSGDTSCGDCECNIDECNVNIEPIPDDCLEICEFQLEVTLPETYCMFQSDIKIANKLTGTVYHDDAGIPVEHTVADGKATRTITINPCFARDEFDTLKNNLDFSISGTACRTTGCPTPQGKLMTLALSSSLVHNISVDENCVVNWKVDLDDDDFSLSFDQCLECCQ
jgi:hypothetical protein